MLAANNQHALAIDNEGWDCIAFQKLARAVDACIVCADLFDPPSTLERLWPCMVASCALDARASRRPAHSSGIEAPELPTLDRVGSALALENVVVDLEVSPSK